LPKEIGVASVFSKKTVKMKNLRVKPLKPNIAKVSMLGTHIKFLIKKTLNAYRTV
jgi:hypothetical protein